MKLPNSLVKNNVVCSLFPSHIILYFLKNHNSQAYKKDMQYAWVKQEIDNTSKHIIEELVPKSNMIHFWYFWEKQVYLTEFIHISMGKQNFDD